MASARAAFVKIGRSRVIAPAANYEQSWPIAEYLVIGGSAQIVACPLPCRGAMRGRDSCRSVADQLLPFPRVFAMLESGR
jgi:hypothetical protein